MKLRRYLTWRTLVVPLALSLTLAACGGGDDGTDPAADAGQPADRPTITVASFNFGESVTIAEIYAQALEASGYPVERELNLGARELIFADLESGGIDFLPEYAGSALGVGFGGEPTSDTEETVQRLREEFEQVGVRVLEPSLAEDKNVFVVTRQFATEHDVSDVSDLADLDEVIFAAPPECEDRESCLIGLQDTYGLDNLRFQSIQETPIRVASLRNGEVDLALMFSTDPPLQDEDLVALEEDEGIIAVENVVPVLNEEVAEAYGQDLISLINSISAELTTEDLIDMNTQVYVEGADSADVARTWLEEHGFLDG